MWKPAVAVAALATIIVFYGSQAGAGVPAQTSSESPLAQYLGFGHKVTADEQRFDQDEQAREEWIAACMGDAGFPYYPTRGSVALSSTQFADMDEAALEKYLDTDDAADENEEYIASLDLADRREYYIRLIGRDAPTAELSSEDHTAQDDNGNGQVDPAERVDLGCVNQASTAIPGVYYAAKLLRSEIQAMEDTITTSAVAATADFEWLECMSQQGFTGETRLDVYRGMEEATVAGEQDVVDRFLNAEPTCNELRTSILAPLRLELEEQFVAANMEVLRRWGVRAEAVVQ